MIMRQISMHRTGEPGEILGLVLYLAAPASRYATGQMITQDRDRTAC
jgi:NAD(P)-dependent dehydrogenase (short-subunit alcohol dehydrogenase family)